MQKIALLEDCLRVNHDTVKQSKYDALKMKSTRISKSHGLLNGDFQKPARTGRKHCCFGGHVVHITWSNDRTRDLIFQSICQQKDFQYTEPKFCWTFIWNRIMWITPVSPTTYYNSNNRWHLHLTFYELIHTFRSRLEVNSYMFMAAWPINSKWTAIWVLKSCCNI